MAATVESLTVALVDQTSTVAGQMDAAMRGAADAADRLAGSADKLAGTVETSDQTITRATRSWQSYATSGIDPAATAAKKVEANQRAASAATQALTNDLTRGKISATEFAQGQIDIAAALAQRNAAADATQARTEKLRGSNDQLTKSTSAGASVLRDLAMQSQDVFSQLASGGSVFTALIQQGSQVSQQMMAAGQGFGALGSAAKIALGAIVSPMGLAVTGVVGLTGALVAAGVAAENQVSRMGNLRQALRLTHDDYVGLADAVDVSARRVAASSSLTRNAAEEIGKSIASSRYLGSFAGDLDDLTKSAANFARVAGVDGAAAGKIFRQAIDDPAAAAEAMASMHLPAMIAALLRTIETLDASGNHAKASALALDTLRVSTKGATDDVSPLSKAMTELGNAFSTTGANGKSFASEIGTFVTNDLAEFLREITDLVHKAQDLRDWIGSKGSSVVIDQNTGKPTNGITLPDGLSNKVYSVAEANGISAQIADLATRIIGQGEHSQGQYRADGSVLTSPKGAQGLMQLMPATAAGQDINPGGKLDPTKLDDNVLLGLRYLSQLGEMFHGNEQQIAAAYNAGPGRLGDVLAGKSALPDETAKYVKNVTGSPFTAAGSLADSTTTLPAVAVSASRYPDSVERALAPFTKLGSEGTPEATQAAAAADIQKYTAAINDLKASGETAGPTMDRLQQLVAKARGEFSNAIGPINSVTRGITDQLAPLLAESGAARSVAEAINQQVLAARGAGRTVTDGQAEAVRAAVLHNLAAAFNDVVVSTDRSTAANLRVAGTLDQGSASFLQATNREKALAQARDDYLPGPAQNAVVDRYTAALNRQSASTADLASVQKSFDQRDQLALLQLETTSLGQNADLRDKEIALLQAKQALIRSGADLDSAASRTSLANVAAISDATAALKAQQASYSELTGFIDNTFSTISDSIVSAFATGEQSAVKFKDVAASVVKAVEAEFIKLALINPLKNLLLGSNSPNLLSVGGIVGKLLGNVTGAGANPAGDAAAAVFGGQGGIVGSAASAVTGAQTSILSGVGSLLSSFSSSLTGGTISSIGSLGSAIVSQVSGAILGNLPTATNLALGAAGQGVYGVATAGEVAVGAASATTGISTTAISSAVSTVASALPAIGAAISVITNLVQGNYRGAGLVAGGALIGTAIFPGLGTAVGAAIGGLVDAFLPNHPKHPFEDVELNIAGGRLATGKSDGQLADVDGLVAGTKNYVDNINNYLDSVGVKIATADGNIGRIGQGITGLAQTLDPATTFNRLDFTNATPNDKSNFSIAKVALDGMKFDTPQALADELSKIAGFADAASTLGITLASVGKDITNIRIASVDTGNQLVGGDTRRMDEEPRTTTVKDASGLSVTFLSDLRTALNADLPKQNFADVAGLDAEIQKVSDFFTGTLPSLLTPMKVTQSTVMDQYNAIKNQYAVAAQQSKNYGLDNTDVLRDAMDRSLSILMEPITRSLNTAAAAVAGRFANLAYGTSGSGAAANDNLMYTQANERASFEDSWRQAWGDSVTSSDAYKSALQQLISTQNLETEATQQQMALAKEQGMASLAASEADFAKRAGMDSLSQQLAAYDTKAAVETDTFIASWRAYYGEYSATGTDFQNQMIALYKAHYAERLQIETDYTTTSNAALKTAQGSVTTLLGSLKDYALKLQTGSQSTLSPTSQYDLAKSQFNAVSGAAAAGDATSASQLTTYADTLLTASQAVYGSGAAYAADFNQVLDALQNVTGNTDALTNSFVAQQLQTQTDTLVASISALQGEVAALRRESQAQTRLMNLAA